MNPKKLHPVDWALGYPLEPEPFIDVGHKLKTAICTHAPPPRECTSAKVGNLPVAFGILHPSSGVGSLSASSARWNVIHKKPPPLARFGKILYLAPAS